MSPKNAIKIINIKKSHSVHSILFGLLWSYSVHVGPILCTSILFSPPLSYYVYFVHFGPIQSTLVLFGPFCALTNIDKNICLG